MKERKNEKYEKIEQMHSERRRFVLLLGGAARWGNPSLLSAIAGVTVRFGEGPGGERPGARERGGEKEENMKEEKKKKEKKKKKNEKMKKKKTKKSKNNSKIEKMKKW